MLLWERAAQQGNLQALLKLGDAHFSGRGTLRNWAQSAKVLLPLLLPLPTSQIVGGRGLLRCRPAFGADTGRVGGG